MEPSPAPHSTEYSIAPVDGDIPKIVELIVYYMNLQNDRECQDTETLDDKYLIRLNAEMDYNKLLRYTLLNRDTIKMRDEGQDICNLDEMSDDALTDMDCSCTNCWLYTCKWNYVYDPLECSYLSLEFIENVERFKAEQQGIDVYYDNVDHYLVRFKYTKSQD